MNVKSFSLSPGETLSHRVIKGGFWVFAIRIIQQVFHLVRLVILARILAPKDFGLMGIALLTLSILETFSQPGFQQALIQKKDAVESYLNSAWTVLIVRGSVLFIIVYLISPYVAVFFNASQAKPIIQIMGFSILLHAFTNIGIVYFQKELEFSKLFIYELTGTLADFIVAVSAVLMLRNVWALVLGLLAGNAVKCVVSHIIHPYRPRLSSDLGKAKELWGFGRWVLGSSMLVFVVTHGDDIFVGKLLGVAALGLYQMAYRISNMPATEIAHVISRVTFPAYSKLQSDSRRIRVAYLKVLQLTAFLAIPIAGLIFVLAPDFVKLFLGEKWVPMVPAMKILAIAGIFRAISATSGPLFYALGQPQMDTNWQTIRLLLLVVFIYPLTTRFGISGTSIAVLISITAITVGFTFATIYKVKCRFKDILAIFAFPIMTSAVMIFLVLLTRGYMGSIRPANFLCLVGISMIIVVTLTYLLDVCSSYKIFKMVKELRLTTK